MKKKIAIRCAMIFACLLWTAVSPAQKFLWDVDFAGFFDNREYGYKGVIPQTIFATRLAPEVGLALSDDTLHTIMGGVNWIQPIGTKSKESKFVPTVYYRYRGDRFRMSFGFFPRTQLIENAPSYLQYDSLTYFRPNIQGALFQYVAPKGFVEMYVDWRRMQTNTDREAFMVAGNGRWQPVSLFFMGGRAVMNHLARARKSPESETVTDDIIFNPYVGLDLSRRTGLDSLTLKCGYLLSLERRRGTDDGWKRPQGILIDLLAEWRFLGLKITFYHGGVQMPYYEQFGTLLNQGDPFFQSRTYNRTDVYAYIFRNGFVNCMASLNLHYTPGYLDFQQQLIVRVNIGNYGNKDRRKGKYLKNIL